MSRYFNPSPRPEVPMPMAPGMAPGRDAWSPRPLPFPVATVEVVVPKKYSQSLAKDVEADHEEQRRARGPSTRHPRFWLYFTVVVLVVIGVAGVAVGVTMAFKGGDSGSDATVTAAAAPAVQLAPVPSPPSPRPRVVPAQRPAATLAPAPAPLPAPTPPVQPAWVPPGAVALFSDDFDGGALDAAKWGTESGQPKGTQDAGQLQTYTTAPANLAVKGGNLEITALQEAGGFTSSLVKSKSAWYPGMPAPGGNGTLASVHVEARLQAPAPGQGLWSAFWLAPVEEKYGAWPQSGEIDVAQIINDASSATQGIHFGAAYPGNQVSDAQAPAPGGTTFAAGMHTFAVDWSKDSISMSVDGVPTKAFFHKQANPAGGWWTAAPGASPLAPFDQPFSIILNLAVGGGWPGPPSATTPFPAVLKVDSVRVWGKQ